MSFFVIFFYGKNDWWFFFMKELELKAMVYGVSFWPVEISGVV